MARTRIEFSNMLKENLPGLHLYFQPTSNVHMEYPALKYKLTNVTGDFANNKRYITKPSYQMTLIDENPDSEFVQKILDLDFTVLERTYTADNLNHWVFIIFY